MPGALQLNLQGHVQAFRDAQIELVNVGSGQKIEGLRPFLDGTLLVRDIEPGQWEVAVRHPNLVLPIDRRRIRIFDQPTPTRIPIPVPAELFRDTPIRDVADADLGPVQALATAARDRCAPLGSKTSGEAIRAADWNTLVGAVVDIGMAVVEMSRLVSPTGHDHPEIAEKIGEVQENLRRFAEAYGRSLIELRREVEAGTLRRRIEDVFAVSGVNADDFREQALTKVRVLEEGLQVDTVRFSGDLSRTGSTILNAINDLAVAQPDGGLAFNANASVAQLREMASSYVEAGVQTQQESELATYRRTTSVGGAKLRAFGV